MSTPMAPQCEQAVSRDTAKLAMCHTNLLKTKCEAANAFSTFLLASQGVMVRLLSM